MEVVRERSSDLTPGIACIVEGHGDVEAVPILLRRLAQERQLYTIKILKPVRCPRNKFVRGNAIDTQELSRAVQLAGKKLATYHPVALLLLIDADEACPALMGPQLCNAIREVEPRIPLGVVLAKREFEAWLVASISSIAQHEGIAPPAHPPADPETLNDPKGYLGQHIFPDGKYSETVDQPRFSDVFDMHQAEVCSSFRKFRREVDRLFGHLVRQA